MCAREPIFDDACSAGGSGTHSSGSSSNSSSKGSDDSSGNSADEDSSVSILACPEDGDAIGEAADGEAVSEVVAGDRTEQERVEGNAPPKSVAQRGVGSRFPCTRNRFVADLFGMCRLTPRFHDGAIVGYQATCAFEGHNKCNKTLSNNVSGGLDNTLRMLKAWLKKGAEVQSKEEHRALWDEIAKSKADNTLPSMADLDATPPSAAAAAAAAARAPAPSSPGVDCPPTPPGIAEAARVLIESNALPRTTPEQRRRNRPKPKVEYKVPQHLYEALKWGYIAPNLPPPAGFVWRACPGGAYRLQPRGG